MKMSTKYELRLKLDTETETIISPHLESWINRKICFNHIDVLSV